MKKRTLKTISMVVALVMLSMSFAFAAIPADVSGSAYEKAVTTLIEAGAITGDSDGLFHPTDSLTRAQACVILVKAMDPPNAEVVGTATQHVNASGFSDMKGYSWADGYVSYAVKHGIVKGYPDGTFKPANKVTSNEMMTMVLRATGVTDDQIGTKWPDDYIAKAEAAGVTASLATPVPEVATKEIAAQMTYNKLTELRKMGTPEKPEEPETPATTEAGILPDVDDLAFATGKFNENMTSYAGTPINKDVVVYTYGVMATYKSDMKLSEKAADYRLDTIQKFKNADTPCFYKKTNGEIVTMVLPMDAGFTGKIYGVVNGSSKTLNGKGETVYSIHTLAAAQKVSWLTKDDTITAPDSAEAMAGEVYELNASNGTIKSIVTAAGEKENEDFVELTGGKWEGVKEQSSGVVTLDNTDEEKFAMSDKAVIYVLSSDGKSYEIGKKGDVKEGASIRAYSISKDEEIASIITVKKP